jgi:hypothetical protein
MVKMREMAAAQEKHGTAAREIKENEGADQVKLLGAVLENQPK